MHSLALRKHFAASAASMAAGLVLLCGQPAGASVIFGQNFSGSLSVSEHAFGMFTAHDGLMGHSGSYTDDEYSYYEFSVNLTNALTATLAVDFAVDVEDHFDRFNVLATSDEFFPPSGLLYDTSGMLYTDEGDIHREELGAIALAHDAGGTAFFDLGGFAGSVVKIRFQFGSDASNTSSGVRLDNVTVSGDLAVIPEPATWAMAILGFFAVGDSLRRRRRPDAGRHRLGDVK